jgi:hypothetical protein
MRRTGHPEPMIREVLDGAGRWLDEVAVSLSQQREESSSTGHDDDAGATPA